MALAYPQVLDQETAVGANPHYPSRFVSDPDSSGDDRYWRDCVSMRLYAEKVHEHCCRFDDIRRRNRNGIPLESCSFEILSVRRIALEAS